jgi:predicted phosphodiesterase
MKIGILSDAHGNPHGLTRCLTALIQEGAEHLYFLGDAVGYLPDWEEVLHILSTNGVVCIQGNHETMVGALSPIDPDRDALYQLEGLRKGKAVPPSIKEWAVSCTGDNVFLTHSFEWNPPPLHIQWAFEGHTHYPSIGKPRSLAAWSRSLTKVNVGSCGLPRDQGDLAACALLDLSKGHCEILRVPLDVDFILHRYGDSIHPAVRAVFARQTADPVGRIVRAEP